MAPRGDARSHTLGLASFFVAVVVVATTAMNPRLFRKQATAAYLNLETRGTIAQIAPPSLRLIFGIITTLFLASVVLGIVGRVHAPLEGRGAIHPSEHPTTLRALRSGRVAALHQHVGDLVAAGDEILAFEASSERSALASCRSDLATISADAKAMDAQHPATEGPSSSADLLLSIQRSHTHDRRSALTLRCDDLERSILTATIFAAQDGIIERLDVVVGDSLRDGDVVGTARKRDVKLVGSMTVPETRRAEIAVGRSVRLAFDAFPIEQFGMGTGKILRLEYVSPSSSSAAFTSTSTSTSASTKTTSDPNAVRMETIVADVELVALPRGVVRVESGMTFTGYVETPKRPLYSLLVPSAGKLE